MSETASRNVAGILFVLVTALSGLLWFPLAKWIIVPTLDWMVRDRSSLDVSTQPRALLTAGLLTGLIVGLVYRGFSVSCQREPSLHFAALLPFVAVNAYLAVAHLFGEAILYGNPFANWILYNACFYIATFWFVVPLGIPYLRLLAHVHRRLESWSRRPTRRSCLHIAWALVALTLIAATDGARFYRQLLATERNVPLTALDVTLPPDAELIHRGPSLSRDVPTAQSFWFRARRLAWPPHPAGQPLTHPDAPVSLAERAQLTIALPTDSQTQFKQTKWAKNHRTIQATLIRTPHHDYIEFIPW